MSTGPLDDRVLADAAWSARAEWRADEHEWAAAAYERWCHERTLVDLAREHLHRGDVVAVATASRAAPITGIVVGVGPDVLALRTASGRVDVAIGTSARIAWRVVERATDGGSRGIVLDGFRARLLELEALAEPVEIGGAVPDGAARGRITVGRDHVVLDDGDTVTVVGLGALEWVRTCVSTAGQSDSGDAGSMFGANRRQYGRIIRLR